MVPDADAPVCFRRVLALDGAGLRGRSGHGHHRVQPDRRQDALHWQLNPVRKVSYLFI